ncbi:Alkaline protease 1-like protein 3 [Colletotrichum musicola]|uniref:Alkaline protease 1-like protein 3 n=1 Tax=Colletotrichum musicola TaxID=2175873 RepID=A0A8H6NTS8_9PEZI|nr:Alkaline protease 1-like protein 3 [Colletotrichum musicola]
MTSSKRITALVAALPRRPALSPPRNRYIISLRRGIDPKDLNSHLRWLSRQCTAGKNITDRFIFGYFAGYAGEFDEATLDELRKDPNPVIAQSRAP